MAQLTRPKSSWQLMCERAEQERDEARAQFDRHVEWAAQQVRDAFRAGFIAHPEAEAPTFQWSFDPETCMATDREESAWQAYRKLTEGP